MLRMSAILRMRARILGCELPFFLKSHKMIQFRPQNFARVPTNSTLTICSSREWRRCLTFKQNAFRTLGRCRVGISTESILRMRHPQDAATIPRISYPQDAPPILGCIFPRMVAAIRRIRPSQDASDHPRMGRLICRWTLVRV